MSPMTQMAVLASIYMHEIQIYKNNVNIIVDEMFRYFLFATFYLNNIIFFEYFEMIKHGRSMITFI